MDTAIQGDEYNLLKVTLGRSADSDLDFWFHVPGSFWHILWPGMALAWASPKVTWGLSSLLAATGPGPRPILYWRSRTMQRLPLTWRDLGSADYSLARQLTKFTEHPLGHAQL